MGITSNPIAYGDCYDAMDRALEDSSGVRVPVDDYDTAVYLRMRMHQARKLQRLKNKEIYPDPAHPMHGMCDYDALTMRIKRDEDQMYVYIERPSPPLKTESLSELEVAEKPPTTFKLRRF